MKFSEIFTVRTSNVESDYFNVLRGGSALAVFLHYIFIFFWEPHIGKGIFNGALSQASFTVAAWAVMIFFILSGFIITSSIYRNISKQEFKSFDYTRYIKDRMYRLYPPLLFSLVIVCLVFFIVNLFQLHGIHSYLLDGDFIQKIDWVSLPLSDLIANTFFLQNLDSSFPALKMNAPLWSLSFEFWYYTLASLISLSLIGKHRWIYAILLVSLLGLLSTLSNAFFFAFGTIIWFAGSFLAILYQTGLLYTLFFRIFLLLTFIVFLAATIFCFMSDNGSIFYMSRNYVAGLMFFGYFGSMLSNKWIKPIKQKRLLIYKDTSRFSYILYIAHWPLLILSNSLFHPLMHKSNAYRVIFKLISFIVIIKITSLSARFFENRKLIENYISTQMRQLSLTPGRLGS